MAKHHFLLSPFGEAHLESGVNRTLIEATAPLAGDWALGWWHARKARDEAVFSRAFWRGRLGTPRRPSAARTELDTFVGRWSFVTDLGEEEADLSSEQRLRVEAYVQGFNRVRRRSGEAPWTPGDCHLLARTLGFLEWWEIRASQRTFLLEAVRAGLEWPRILDLWPDLGFEPDRSLFDVSNFPQRFSHEAQAMIGRIRRFRPTTAWIIPGSSDQASRPQLAASYVTDIGTPGLPFLPVAIETPEGSIRGLSRPGHPGFLAGKTRWLAWHTTPAIDDTIDLRVLDRHSPGTAGFWAGAGWTGTLKSLLILEEEKTAGQAREHTLSLGSACLDWTSVDSRGGTARWSQGPRWFRPDPKDAWLPTSHGGAVPSGGPRLQPAEHTRPAGWVGNGSSEAFLTQGRSDLVEEILPSLRFLLPDNELGQKLRRWTGVPERGTEAKAFERLYDAVLEVFWEDSPIRPRRAAPEYYGLLPAMIRLIQAPHSAWFPSAEKNLKLAEAVRRAFSPGRPEGFPSLAQRTAQPRWSEDHGGYTKKFATTATLVVDPGLPEWKVCLTEGEAEVKFRAW